MSDNNDVHEAKSGDADRKNLAFVLDIPLQLTVELGRTKLLVKDVLQLNQGSVVELTKLAGEPLDVFVNSKLVARGEAVVVNDKFGVRLVDVVSPNERVEKVL
jgi:flagellar motor switch protein FliN